MQNMNETIKSFLQNLCCHKIEMFSIIKNIKYKNQIKYRKYITEFIIMSERIQFMIFDHFLRLYLLPSEWIYILFKVNRIGKYWTISYET